jgi:uncharacterized membrane protein
MDSQRLVKGIVAATLLWPLLLTSAAWASLDGSQPVWSAAVYVAGSRICHQKPERSFKVAGVQWPVCGRCSGLYLAAPLGAIAASIALRRRRGSGSPRVWLAVAAVPTAITLGLEWLSLADVTNVARFVSAWPLGAAVAYTLVIVAADRPRPFGYTGTA